MHALIIEDESLIAMEIEEVLRGCGFSSFDFAVSAEEAVAAAARNCPDLITADVQLRPGCGIRPNSQFVRMDPPDRNTAPATSPARRKPAPGPASEMNISWLGLNPTLAQPRPHDTGSGMVRPPAKCRTIRDGWP